MQFNINNGRSINTNYVKATLALLTLLVLFLPDAHASAGGGGGLPYEGWLGKVTDSITGPVAYAISLGALVAAGAALIFGGDMNGFMKALLFITLVLSMIVAAKNFLSGLTGTGATVAPMAQTLVVPMPIKATLA
jgi:type IV secretory pathway VirB2 component (pilin)